MKITAKITRRYDFSKNVLVTISLHREEATYDLGELLTTEINAGWFLRELDRLHAVDDWTHERLMPGESLPGDPEPEASA